MMLLLLFLLLAEYRSEATIQFKDITEASGLSGPLQGMMGHAAAWGDFNNDGRPDLFVGGFCDRPAAAYAPAKGPIPTRLFQNLGQGKFLLIKNTPTEFCARSTGAVFADLNRDGFPELYVANNAKGEKDPAQKIRSKLFENRNGTYRDISVESGVSPEDLLTARNVAILDYNSDGLLDLLVIEDKFKAKKLRPRSILLKNAGNLRFEVANAEAGLPADLYGLGLAIADLSNDGRPDFFVAHSNRLFLSTGGNRFREATESNHLFRWKEADSEDWPSGAAFGDLNVDGNLDLVVSNHHDPARMKVFLNEGLKSGIPSFKEVTKLAGVAEAIPAKSPHVEIQDFDNDGLPDIYTTAAWKQGNQVVPLIYKNEGSGEGGLPHFKPIREIKSPMMYFPAGPTADFNGDGKLDVLLVNWFQNESSHLLSNQTAGGNWLQIKAPIGTKLKLFSARKLMGYQQVWVGYGFASGQLPICHFGTGKLIVVDLEIQFPNSTIRKMKNLSVNRLIEVKE